MKRTLSVVPVALLLTMALSSATFGAASVGPWSISHFLAVGSGGPTIPAAWAGVWQTADSLKECDSTAFVFGGEDELTLCTGDPVLDAGPGSCSGTANDTNVNVTCSFSEEIFPGCDVTQTVTLVATRTGDSFSAEITNSTDYEPDGCAGKPDSCTVTVSTATRIGPEPPSCTSAVASGSWGRTKASYR